MRKNIILFYIGILMVFIISGCKKSTSDYVAPSFKADTVFTLLRANAFPSYNDWNSIAMDQAGNKIFFYYSDAAEGFKIDMLDIPTGAVLNIYKHFTQSGQTAWHQTNGSEGMRLRYFPNTAEGNKLIVPGGATNLKIVEIRVNPDYSTTFQRVDSIPENSSIYRVENGYDSDLTTVSGNNYINVVSMWNDVYNINGLFPTYPVSETSHGSSIVGTPGGMEYVFCGYKQLLESYNNGVYIRGVTLPGSEAQLQMDSKKRIYAYNGDVILRYSSDLLTKETFKVTGPLTGYRQEALVIKEMPGYIQAYSFNEKDLIGIRLPL